MVRKIEIETLYTSTHVIIYENNNKLSGFRLMEVT